MSVDFLLKTAVSRSFHEAPSHNAGVTVELVTEYKQASAYDGVPSLVGMTPFCQVSFSGKIQVNSNAKLGQKPGKHHGIEA